MCGTLIPTSSTISSTLLRVAIFVELSLTEDARQQEANAPAE
jgi:hypothetical protein